MNWLRKIIQRFWCYHNYEFVRNIYGDEISQCGGYRSLWECTKCGKIKYCKRLYRPSLYKIPLYKTLNNLYDEYYENEYENWCNEHNEFLIGVTNQLMATASKGKCYEEIIMCAKESTNDKYYFEQWLIKNNLESSCSLYNQKEKYDELNTYKFEIRWK